MEELTLTIEGIKNKVQKLAIRNSKLLDKIDRLEEENKLVQDQLKQEMDRSHKLEQELVNSKLTFTLDKTHSKQAKQKINEMLREIDKCYALLNR